MSGPQRRTGARQFHAPFRRLYLLYLMKGVDLGKGNQGEHVGQSYGFWNKRGKNQTNPPYALTPASMMVAARKATRGER